MMSSSFLIFGLFFLHLLPSAYGARILVTAAVDSGTHIGSMVPMITKLVSSGHHVTVLEIATLVKPRDLGPNVTMVFVPVPGDQGIAASLSASMFRTVLNGRILHLPYVDGDHKFKEYILSTYAKLFRSILDTPFDLVILDELFGVHSFAIALHLHHYRGVPYILYATTMMIQSSAYSLALGRNFVSEPNLLTAPPVDSMDKFNPRSLANRLNNLHTIGWDLYRVLYQVENMLRSSGSSVHLLAVPDFTFFELFSGASFVFTDYLDRAPVPMTESTQLLPISAHCALSRNVLPPDLAQFVADPSSHGTIYVAFGTNLHSPRETDGEPIKPIKDSRGKGKKAEMRAILSQQRRRHQATVPFLFHFHSFFFFHSFFIIAFILHSSNDRNLIMDFHLIMDGYN